MALISTTFVFCLQVGSFGMTPISTALVEIPTLVTGGPEGVTHRVMCLRFFSGLVSFGTQRISTTLIEAPALLIRRGREGGPTRGDVFAFVFFCVQVGFVGTKLIQTTNHAYRSTGAADAVGEGGHTRGDVDE